MSDLHEPPPTTGPQRRSVKERMAAASQRDRSDLADPSYGDASQLTSTTTSMEAMSGLSTAFVIGDEGEVVRTDVVAPIAAPLETSESASVIDLDRALSHHLLLLSDEVDPAEIEALALSIWDVAAWEGAGRLHLTGGARLEGPWALDVQMRRQLGTPASLDHVWVLKCPRSRRAAVPEALAAVDEWAAVFPKGTPTGLEFRVLSALKRIARRLGGALRLSDSGAVVAPDPDSAVSFAIYTPRWLDPQELLAALETSFPQIHDSRDSEPIEPAKLTPAQEAKVAELSESLGPVRTDIATKIVKARAEVEKTPPSQRTQVVQGYAAITPIANRSDLVIEVQAVPRPPQVLRWEPWTTGVIIEYMLRWLPGGSGVVPATGMTRSARLERVRAVRDIEKAAGILVSVVGGSVIDEDGFLVALEEETVPKF